MAFSLGSITLAEVRTDLAKVEDIVAVIEKYEAVLPIPPVVKEGVAYLSAALQFAEKVLADG